MPNDVLNARILAVDDEPVNLILLERLLEGAGYHRLELLDDPRQVLAAYHRERPDLILLDLNMPGMSGFEVMDRLIALQDPMLPPVIVITAQVQRDYLLQALQAGARDFVTKPFDIHEMRLRVHNALEGHRNQMALHEMKQQLSDLVNLRTVAMEKAESATRVKSEFLSNMSHELRTPMNAVLGMLQLLETTPLTPKQSEYVSKTRLSARALLDILNDILDFSKVEAGKMQLDPEPFQPHRLLQELSFLLFSNLGQRQLELLFDVDPALPDVLVADALRLKQVLINLAGNAIKFTAQGEIRLSVQVLEREAQRWWVRFAVQDTGIGISADQQARIFQGFSQAEASTSRRYGGTGLGLAISQRLVQLMGGQLLLDSVPGQGSTFHFDIPLVLSQSAPAGETEVKLPVQQKVLVVEPHAGAQSVARRLIGHFGWTAQVCSVAEQAMEHLQTASAAGQPFDALWLDVGGQPEGAAQWVRRWREQPGGLPVGQLFAVARPGTELAWPADACSAVDGWIFKPLTPRSVRDSWMQWTHHGPPGLAAEGAVQAQADTHVPGLHGVRILLVEDNPINQDVALQLLEHEGAVASLAENGLEAVQCLSHGGAGNFDIVLMDMQMHQMDGLQATRVIREQLGLTSLPIVAMTANAMASDRQACLQAGMNEHLGKPFDAQELVAMVRRMLGLAPVGQGPLPPRDRPCEPQDNDHVLAHAEATVRLNGDRAFYLNSLQRFTLALPRDLQEALRCWDAGDLRQAERALHTLKGSAGVVGAQALKHALAQAEQALREAVPGQAVPLDASALLAQVQRFLQAARPLLPQVLPVATPPSASALLSADARRQLQAVLPLLERHDFDALERLDALFGHHVLPDGSMVQTLKAAADAIDFDRARTCVSALLAM